MLFIVISMAFTKIYTYTYIVYVYICKQLAKCVTNVKKKLLLFYNYNSIQVIDDVALAHNTST